MQEQPGEQQPHADPLDDVVRGVTSEFNNLLTVVLGYADIVLSEMPVAAPWQEEIQQIREAALRGARLTHQLLAYSQRQILRAERHDAGALIRGLETTITHLVPLAIRTKFTFCEERLPVLVDAEQLGWCVLSLVRNGVAAIRQGGTLHIAVAEIDVPESRAVLAGSLQAGIYAEITVTDSGPGMPPTTLARAALPFFTTNEAADSLGLGLPAVRGIMLQSGGALDIRSEAGAGTTVALMLPLEAS